MNTIEDFIGLIRDGLGLPVTVADASRSLDDIPDWDSVHLLWLATSLERETGRAVSLASVLEAGSLEQIYQLAARS